VDPEWIQILPLKPFRIWTHIMVLRAREASVADPGPGSGAFLTPGSGAFLTPGSGMGKKIRIWIRDEHHGSCSKSLETIFWVEIL
jgi:hypothetical protein